MLAAALGARANEQPLSASEIDVLRTVANNGRTRRVAAEMGLSEATVKAHMKNILTKLNTTDRVHAVMIAVHRGIIELDP